MSNIMKENILEKCSLCPYFSSGISDLGYCDKTGGKIVLFGTCTDYPIKTKRHSKSRIKKRNKRERDRKFRNHLKRISEMNFYPQAGYYVCEKYIHGHGWVKIDKPYYRKIWIGNGRKHGYSKTRWTKRKCNRAVRRYKNDISNGCMYKKISEYWWEIF